MYTFCVVMIAIASILLILAVLVQSPKSGMAANFGAANQTIESARRPIFSKNSRGR